MGSPSLAARPSPIREQERAPPGRDPAASAPPPGKATRSCHCCSRGTGWFPEVYTLSVDADTEAGDRAEDDGDVESPAARPEVDADGSENRAGGDRKSVV